MQRGICHRCWRHSSLREDWPISAYCFRKWNHLDDEGVYSFSYRQIEACEFWITEGDVPFFNFLTPHRHYSPLPTLRWREGDRGTLAQLDLAINIMAIAYPPQPQDALGLGTCETPHHVLFGGSVIHEDIWKLHHFFCAEFIQPALSAGEHAGAYIPLEEARNWMQRMTASRVSVAHV